MTAICFVGGAPLIYVRHLMSSFFLDLELGNRPPSFLPFTHGVLSLCSIECGPSEVGKDP